MRAFLLLFVASLSSAAEVAVIVTKDGCGLIDSIQFGERRVVQARVGFPGATITLAPAGDGSLASLFGRTAGVVLPAKLDSVEGTHPIEVRGRYTDGVLSIPFRRSIAVRGQTVRVEEETDFGGLPATHLVAAQALRVPFVVTEDEHDRLLAFGGGRRAEMFRMDMNDERRRNQLLSDNRAFQPYWDLGGIAQSNGAYRIWRANHANTMAYPIEDGTGTESWADYSEPDWGLTVGVAAAPPWSIVIDARAGVLEASPLPPDQMPREAAGLGKRTCAFELRLHERSWPTAWPCELDYAQYRRLLALLNPEGRYTHLDHLCSALGLMTKDGAKSAVELDAIARRIILRERVQPSVLLRLLYRGDGWRMSGVVQELLGRRVPRDQPLEAWDGLAREVLDALRK